MEGPFFVCFQRGVTFMPHASPYGAVLIAAPITPYLPSKLREIENTHNVEGQAKMVEAKNKKRKIQEKRRGVRQLKHIHAVAMEEVLNKSGKIADIWALYAELRLLKQYRARPVYQEAFIAICVIGRIRPRLARNSCRRLREIYADRGVPEAFDAFCAKLDVYMAPDRMTSHGYEGSSFETAQESEIWEIIRDVMEVLEDEGFRCFLNSGTLLGAVRDQKLIGHDDDVDLGVILKGRNQAAVRREWSRLRDVLAKHDLLDADRTLPEIIRVKTSMEFGFDLFPSWSAGGRFFVYPHTFGTLETRDVLPLQKCATTGLAIPAQPEKMLAINYGDGWRVPDRFFKFPWGEARGNFAEFLGDVREDDAARGSVPAARAA